VLSFRGLSEAEAGFRMPSASHWIDGHLTLLWLTPSPLVIRFSSAAAFKPVAV